MRFRLLGILVFAATMLPATDANAQLSPQWESCTENQDLDARIKACTAMIESGQETPINLSVAYNNRGNAYRAKGDFDRAIADFNDAIGLDPNLPTVYYNRGNAYDDKGELDRAIADFNAAIRLDPKFAFAYNNRASVYNAKGDFDRAIADYSAAIRLDPKYAVAYNNRGNAYSAKGAFDRAIADCSDAIRLDPGYALAYRTRGIAYLYKGDLAKALADVGQASKLDPKQPYSVLWLDIVEKRDNVASTLPQTIAHVDMTTWPALIVRMFLGRATPAAVLAAANDPDATKRKGQVCEADFYGGEFALRTGAKDEAVALFRLASSNCPKYFDEWGAANHELKALGSAP
ncbi:MAG: tetratricopeptide repeat protein [Methylovirgula sp.]